MKSVIIPILCSTLLSTPTFMSAFGTVWPSYAIPILESPESPLGYAITSDDANLIGSIPLLGSFIGTVFGGFVSEFLGRKKTEIFCGLLMVLSWSITIIAKAVPLLLIGRLTLGLGNGIHLVTALVYINEISQSSICGVTVNILFFLFSFGTLVSYIVGWFCSYYMICYLNLSIGVAFVALMCLLKDSPGYLIGKGREKEALAALKFYRCVSLTTQDVLNEFAYIKSQRGPSTSRISGTDISSVGEENVKLKPEDEKQEKEESSWKILRTSKASQRALITTAIIVILTILTGIAGIQAYAGQLFKLAAPELSSDLCSVIFAIVLSVTGALATVVTGMFGRRTLLLFSTITTTLSLIILGTILRWEWAPAWAAPSMVLLYCGGFQMGASNIPFVQLGESLLPQVKSLGTSIITCCLFLACFIGTFIFVPFIDNLGPDNTFFIFGLISAIATVVSYLIVKETKDVKFEAVQDMYARGYLCRYPNKC